jgi:nucleoside-diphosphate-sugar epimerase
MTVLVTGGSGLVGSHVIEALHSRGERVRALVRTPSRAAVERLGAEAVVGDVTDPAAWRRAAQGVRGIVHAAALVQRRATWQDHVAVNVGGTRLAVAAAHAAGARLVHISSVSVYGGSAAYRPEHERRTEEYPFQQIPEHDFYARTKRMAEEVVRDSAAEDGSFSAVALRPNVIYGERDRLFTPRVIGAVRRGFVPRIGPGTNHLSCVYVGHVATAAAAALDTPVEGFRAYNVTHDAPPALTLREFLEAFGEALGSRLRAIPVPAGLARIVMGLWTDPRLARAAVSFISGENPYVDDRARAELGWQPGLGTAEAVRRTAHWFLENETPGR